MKRLFILFLAAVMILCVTGCAKSDAATDGEENKPIVPAVEIKPLPFDAYGDIVAGNSVDDVMAIDPDGKYPFLTDFTGTAEKKSVHYTLDGYCIKLSYDADNKVTEKDFYLIEEKLGAEETVEEGEGYKITKLSDMYSYIVSVDGSVLKYEEDLTEKPEITEADGYIKITATYNGGTPITYYCDPEGMRVSGGFQSVLDEQGGKVVYAEMIALVVSEIFDKTEQDVIIKDFEKKLENTESPELFRQAKFAEDAKSVTVTYSTAEGDHTQTIDLK